MLARTVLAVQGVALALIAFAEAGLSDRILYNASPSVPTGFYARINEPPVHGSLVTVRASDVAPDYARVRGFADRGDRFIKRIAAVAGDRVCTDGDVVHVAAAIVHRSGHDSIGHALPRWNGCRALGQSDVFLLGETPDSFDSRYFGPVRTDQIEGVWRPL